ncbi:MAG: hypothetical protein BWX64_02707 [Acidobacteria bacterium ADurb.Bin051]|nr:MAG: hypothetical protein BWX64_02707 [Acidobacteria bacterium ADurb.Bin051]
MLLEAGERERARHLAAVVDELAVDLVGDQEETVLAAERPDRLELGAGVDGAGRVVRVAEDHGPGARGPRPLELGDRRQVEAVLAAGGDGHQPHPRHRREGGVVRVERLDDQDLVAVVAGGEHREEDRLAAAGGGDDLVALERQPDLLVVALQDTQALRGSGRGGVGNDLGDVDEARPHRGRRGQVGLADVEVVDVDAALARVVGERHQLADRGGGQEAGTMGDLRTHGAILGFTREPRPAPQGGLGGENPGGVPA